MFSIARNLVGDSIMAAGPAGAAAAQAVSIGLDIVAGQVRQLLSNDQKLRSEEIDNFQLLLAGKTELTSYRPFVDVTAAREAEGLFVIALPRPALLEMIIRISTGPRTGSVEINLDEVYDTYYVEYSENPEKPWVVTSKTEGATRKPAMTCRRWGRHPE